MQRRYSNIMNSREKKVLIITSHYPPNIGGVENHLQELVAGLLERKWKVIVSTYQPLAQSRMAPFREERAGFTIYRFPWIGFNIFHKLAPYPALEFLFLFPGLFLMTFFALIKHPNVNVIHCQGLVPSTIGVFMKFLFQKRVIASTHNLYFFPTNGLYPFFARLFFSLTDKVLTPTVFAKEELLKIGVSAKKVAIFHYWIDLEKFCPKEKLKIRKRLKWDKFTILFVGRLIETKGIKLLLQLLPNLNKKIQLVVIGTGPMGREIKRAEKHFLNFKYLGGIENNNLPDFYSAADLVVVPSLVDEGFGFVAMEALACGTPVLASKKGGLLDAVSTKTGKLVEPNGQNFKKAIERLFYNPTELNYLKSNCREYVLKNFSNKNILDIIKTYGTNN